MTLSYLSRLPGSLSQSSPVGDLALPAFGRIKNYDKQDQEALHRIFGKTHHSSKDATSTEDLLSVGLTQTTFNNGDEDDECDSCNGSAGEVVGRDLFMATFENIGTEAEVLNATMNEAEEELEAAWRRFKSHYWKLGWEEREEHKASFDNLVSTMGGNVARKRRHNSVALGTQGMVVEQHSKLSRTYNTHNTYYR